MQYAMVAVKRRWVPEWLYALLAPKMTKQPFRWLFNRELSELEKRRGRPKGIK